MNLTTQIGYDVAKEIYHSVNANLIIGSVEQPLGDECVNAKLLCKEDVSLEWMFSMGAWHITQVFLNK